jgi:hypothetical protein
MDWSHLPPEMRAHIVSFLDPVSAHMLACTTPHEDVTQCQRDALLRVGMLSHLIQRETDITIVDVEAYFDYPWQCLRNESVAALVQGVGRASMRFVLAWLRYLGRHVAAFHWDGSWPRTIVTHFAASGMRWESILALQQHFSSWRETNQDLECAHVGYMSGGHAEQLTESLMSTPYTELAGKRRWRRVLTMLTRPSVERPIVFLVEMRAHVDAALRHQFDWYVLVACEWRRSPFTREYTEPLWHGYARAVGVQWDENLVDALQSEEEIAAVLGDTMPPGERDAWLVAMRPYCTERFYAAVESRTIRRPWFDLRGRVRF